MRRKVPEGVIVRITHHRALHFTDGQRAGLGTSQSAKKAGLRISPKGGETRCFLLDKEGGVLVETTAVCNEKDQFNKKIGRDIALGRALALLEASAGKGALAPESATKLRELEKDVLHAEKRAEQSRQAYS